MPPSASRRPRARRSTCCWCFSIRRARRGGEPCTFLLDEVLELRTFESFPGLRHVLRDLLEGLAAARTGSC